MAVLIEAISVVVKANALHERFPGGWDEFRKIVPNQTLCADNEVVRVGFMTPVDVEGFVKKLERSGLSFMVDGCAQDMAVVDQARGITTHCDWLEFGRLDLNGDGQKVAACRLVGSNLDQVVTPIGWRFEGSLSQSYGFVPTEHENKSLTFLRHENGQDVYFNELTGKEVFVGRTGES